MFFIFASKLIFDSVGTAAIKKAFLTRQTPVDFTLRNRSRIFLRKYYRSYQTEQSMFSRTHPLAYLMNHCSGQQLPFLLLLLALLLPNTFQAQTTLVQQLLQNTGWDAAVDSTITYSARDISISMDREYTWLKGDARIIFQGMELEAEWIEINWASSLLTARGVPDTTWTDSTRTEIDSLFVRGTPVFNDRDGEIRGAQMVYNFHTRRGKILQGKTELGDGYYYGRRIKKHEGNALHISKGNFTSCDREEPHYHFYSPRMKLLIKDKIVAKPVWLYFGRVRTFGIPFAVFSIKRGRRSGLIMPSYSESSRRGHELNHLGWYWAPSRYWDSWVKMDYADKGPDYLFDGNMRYRLRDRLSGRVNASWFHSGLSYDRAWDLNISHDQQLTPYLGVRARISYASSADYYRNASDNQDTRLQQSMNSSVNLAGKIPAWKDSYSLGLSYNQNLVTESGSGHLPVISYRHGSRSLFPGAEEGYLSRLNYSYNSKFDVPVSYSGDSDEFLYRAGISHSSGISGPLKLGPLALSPGISLQEHWVDRYQELRLRDGVVDTVEVNGFARRLTFSANTALSTKIYGLFRTHWGALEAVRHVITPSTRFSFRPDFSSEEWGYYSSASDDSTEYRLDRFSGSMWGGTGSRRSLTLSGSLGNLFQAKVRRGEEEVKTDLLNVNSNFNYDFFAETFPLSDISSRFSASPLQALGVAELPVKGLGLEVSTVHSMYKRDSQGNMIDRYIFLDGYGSGPRLPRLQSFSFSTSISFSGITNRSESDTTDQLRDDPILDRFDPQIDPIDMSIPWNGSISLYYQENRYIPDNPDRSAWLSGNLSFNFTRNWKITWRGRYDLNSHDLVSQQISVYRDLHCWEARFSWTPSGPYESFFLKISVKSPTLRDLKLEKRSGRSSGW